MDTRAIRWNTLWRPLLYESLGWFLGAFLILAGSFYFVAESWAGLPTLARALVVFGFTAGYTMGFALWGAFLSRRPALAGAGRVLALIGSAIAPLAALPLSLAGPDHTVLTLAVAGLWAVLAAALMARVTGGVDPASRRPVPLAMGLATLCMGGAGVAAGLGKGALWLDVLPLACAAWTVLGAPARTSARAMVFAVLAPVYLGLLFVVRLHVALLAAGASPSLPTYAPYGAAALMVALQVRRKYGERNADALDVGAVAVQLALGVAAVRGDAPAFFVTWAVLAATALQLGQGAPSRVRWLYAAYGALYFSYQSVGQLVPGFLKQLLAQLRQALGYAQTAPLPVNFDAVYAVPFILAGCVIAWRLRGQPAPAHLRHRHDAVAEVLLRSTAVASGAAGLLAVCGGNQRAALWSVPALVALCLAAGRRFRHRWLSHAGVGLTLLVPVFVTSLWGGVAGALAASAGACVWTWLPPAAAHADPRVRLGLGTLLGVWACVLAGGTGPGLLSALAIGLAGGAFVRAAQATKRPEWMAIAWLALLAAVPWAVIGAAPSLAPVATALAGVALIGGRVRRRNERALLVPALGAAAVAALWQCVDPGGVASPVLFTVTLGLAAWTFWLGSKREPALGCAAALLLCGALVPAAIGLPRSGTVFSPVASATLFASLSAATSFRAALGKASFFSTTVAALSVSGALASALAGDGASVVWALAAVTALLSTRALHASVTLPLATVFGAVALAPHGTWGTLGLAVAVSGAGLLPRWRAGWDVLAGGRRMAVASALSGATALLVALCERAFDHPAPFASVLACAGAGCSVVLPMLWTRATKWCWLSVFIAPFATLWLLVGNLAPGLPCVPTGVFALTWMLEGSAIAGWLGLTTRGRHVFQTCSVLSLLLSAGALVIDSPVPLWLGGALFAGALATSRSRLPALRLVAAALVCIFVGELPLPAIAALLPVAGLATLRPAWLERVLGAPASNAVRHASAWAAVGLSLTVWNGLHAAWAPCVTAAVLLGVARILRWRWVAALAVAVAGLGPWLVWVGPRSTEVLLWVSVGGAAAAACARRATAQRWLAGAWGSPLWLGSAVCLAAVLLAHSGTVVAEEPTWAAAAMVLAGILLVLTPDALESVLAGTLLGGAAAACVPPGSIPVGVGAVGLAACAAGWGVERRHRVGRVLHFTGAVLCVLALGLVRELDHLATPLAFGLATCAVALVAARNRRFASAPWVAGLVSAHVALAHLGVVWSTGKPPQALLPVVGLASALTAVSAHWALSGPRGRRLALAFSAWSLLEVAVGTAMLAPSPTSAPFGLAAALIVCAGAVHHALRDEDEVFAALAVGALLMTYAVVRAQLWGGLVLGWRDAVAAIGAGTCFGLVRAGVFRRTARVAAYLLPLLGLLAVPWQTPTLVADVLAGCAVHFAALALWKRERRVASLFATACFDASLGFLWWGTRLGDPVYYVLPAGLSVLVLVWVFRRELSPSVAAFLRGTAITAIYVSSAWRALSFEHMGTLIPCVAVCLTGVAAGIALKIRSYVFLGTGVLVTSVLANLVHAGLQDHRLGALFLSAFGLAVVAFMIVFTSNRSELFRRYEGLRAALAAWDA